MPLQALLTQVDPGWYSRTGEPLDPRLLAAARRSRLGLRLLARTLLRDGGAEELLAPRPGATTPTAILRWPRAKLGRLVRDLGTHRAMILRNHGLLSAGRTVAEAFSLIHYLEKCCQSQIDALSGGQKLTIPPGQVCEHTAQQYEAFGILGTRDWPGHLRRLDKLDPSYKE